MGIIMLVFFLTVVFVVFFGFSDLYIRQRSGHLLLKITGPNVTQTFILKEPYEEIELWLKTSIQGKGLQVVKGRITVSIKNSINNSDVTLYDDNTGLGGKIFYYSASIQRKSLGMLQPGTYTISIQKDPTLVVDYLEVRGYKNTYWLSKFAR